MRILAQREQRESEVQRAVVDLYRTFGCNVAHFSERRTSRITPGWPDLIIFPPKGYAFAHETKAPWGKQSAAQSAIETWFRRCGMAYVIGGTVEAREHLEQLGLIAL